MSRKAIPVHEVSENEWNHRFHRYGSLWEEFGPALEKLREGKRIKIPAGDNPHRLRTNLQEYAARVGIRTATSISKDMAWVYACPKNDGWRDFSDERRRVHHR